ncbi:hypothetical protein BMS3Abin08_00297 [bacterium BMS3Abin08]|nr:hypothetical protein BMS3Abin08_00297 [bacterium BMS3Abin08]
MKQKLTIDILVREARAFCEKESKYDNPEMLFNGDCNIDE